MSLRATRAQGFSHVRQGLSSPLKSSPYHFFFLITSPSQGLLPTGRGTGLPQLAQLLSGAAPGLSLPRLQVLLLLVNDPDVPCEGFCVTLRLSCHLPASMRPGQTPEQRPPTPSLGSF